jgi:probable HAF family extracellular repeat protein
VPPRIKATTLESQLIHLIQELSGRTLNDPLGVDGTFATSINYKGQIVGYYFDNLHNQHGFLYEHGKYTTIDDPLGTQGSYLTGINDRAQIVGIYIDHGLSHGFLVTGA